MVLRPSRYPDLHNLQWKHNLACLERDTFSLYGYFWSIKYDTDATLDNYIYLVFLQSIHPALPNYFQNSF